MILQQTSVIKKRIIDFEEEYWNFVGLCPRFCDIMIIPNAVANNLFEPIPIHMYSSQYDQEGHDNTSVTYNGTQVIDTKPNSQKNPKWKKEAEIYYCLLPGFEFFPYKKRKDKKQ